MADSYDAPIPAAKTGDSEKPIAQKIAEIIKDSDNLYATEYDIRETLRIVKESIFDTKDPTNLTRRVEAFMPYLAFLKMYQQFQLPDITLECAAVSPNKLATVQALFEDALEQSNWRNVLTGTNGAQAKMIGYGDAFPSFGRRPEYDELGTGFPFSYRLENTARIKFPKNAVKLWNPGDERECRQLVILREKDLDQAWEDDPILKRNGISGKILMEIDEKMNTQTDEQENREERIVETAEFIDLNKRLSVKMSGATNFLHDEFKGDEFPHIDRNNQARFPMMHLVAYEREQGMLNFGLLHATYRFAIIIRILQNKKIEWTISNTNPVRIVALGDMSQTDFVGRHTDAIEDQKVGKTGVIYTKGSEKATIGHLGTPGNALINAANESIAEMEKNIQRLGVNIDDITIDTAEKLGQTELAFESQTAAARSIQKQNADEYQRGAEFLQDAIIMDIDDDNDVPLRAKNKIRDDSGNLVAVPGIPVENEDGVVETVSFTLGDLASELKANDYRIKISGGIVNPRTRIRRIERDLQRDLIMLANLGDQKAARALSDLTANKFESEGIPFRFDDVPETSLPENLRAIATPEAEEIPV